MGKLTRFGYALSCLLLLWMMQGCAHETTFTQSDIHLYSGRVQGMPRVQPDSLVCVSFNIAFSEKLDQALVDLDKNSTLQNVDILLLQEMDATGTAYLAGKLGMNYYYYPSFIHPHHGRLFGNSILSPWPLENPRWVVLPHANPLTDNLRSALTADVKIGTRSVQVVSVHLATLIVGLDNRVEQAVVLRDSLIAPAGPSIVGGDFNSGTDLEGNLFSRVMREVGFRKARLPGGRTARGGPLDIVGYHLKLDHIYYRDLEYVSAGVHREATASDHFPIWSVFRWADKR
jgi:endonuclease/exonuclease/phosphatase (EEP) superfamily protein YafD